MIICQMQLLIYECICDDAEEGEQEDSLWRSGDDPEARPMLS